MSDAELREIERALGEAPDDVPLLRQQAALLRRYGQAERALSALDLAWRLGATELTAELTAELEARRLELCGLGLRYVPAGPFVMGLEGFDADCSPARLVQLSAFYVSEIPVTWSALRDTPLVHPSMRRAILDDAQGYYSRTAYRAGSRQKTEEAVGHLDEALQRTELPQGRVWLPTEAQWERALRASLLRADGSSIYGVRPGDTVEWVRDAYRADAYATSTRFDPQGPADSSGSFVVRGVSNLPPDVYPLYRDAASPTGSFQVRGWLGDRSVRHEGGIAFRIVLEPR